MMWEEGSYPYRTGVTGHFGVVALWIDEFGTVPWNGCEDTIRHAEA